MAMPGAGVNGYPHAGVVCQFKLLLPIKLCTFFSGAVLLLDILMAWPMSAT